MLPKVLVSLIPISRLDSYQSGYKSDKRLAWSHKEGGNECSIHLPINPIRQPLLQFLQRLPSMADPILLALLHLRICLTLVLKARIPSYPVSLVFSL